MMISRTSIKEQILKFLPLLLLYLVMLILLSSETLTGDEIGYARNANHLVGVGSSADPFSLWWGPGYPIILMPFSALGTAWVGPKFLNAFFLFGAILYFYNTLTFWLRKTQATVIAYLLGLYPPFWREVHLLITESFVLFLVCGFVFHFCTVFKDSRRTWLHLLITSVYLAYLSLTKVFFGYVLVAGIFSFGALYLWQRKEKFKQTVLIYLLALILCSPYLFYTYTVTNKIFYWGTSGGLSLYWMSTPYEDELGSWFSPESVQTYPELAQHREFFNRIAGLSDVEQDDALKKQALDNIARHPEKYFINWTANIGRLLFSYPFSYGQDRLSTFFYLIPNMFIVVLLALSIYPAVLRWKSIPFEIFALLGFVIVAFGGTSLLSAYDRQFRPLVPILLLWLSFVYLRILKIETRPETELVLYE
jgi:hypothetical protein